MADYSNSKPGVGGVFPENAIEDSYPHCEPLITAAQLKTRHLFGIPMVSAVKDPITGKPEVVTPEIMNEFIHSAIAQAEQDLQIDIFPVKRREKHPFDQNLYQSFMYFQLQHKPVTSIDKLSVTPSSGNDVYVVPNDWVETAYLPKGQVNVVPLSVAYVSGTYIGQDQSGGGSAFMVIMGMKGWIPAFWQLEYTSGFKDGMVPRVINEYIGLLAAKDLLSQLATTYARVQSFSQGIDGMSQSVSTPGPQVFSVRINEIKEKLDAIRGKIKAQFGHKIFAGTL